MRPPVLLLLLGLLAGASAFVPNAAGPSSTTCNIRRAAAAASSAVAMRAEQQPQQPQQPPRAVAATDRRGALSQTFALPLLAGAALGLAGTPPRPSRAAAKKGPSGPNFEETMATLLLAKEVLAPVKRYVEIGQFDPARTNIKYVVNQFRIKKAMERAVLLAFEKADTDPAKLDEAAEVTAVVDNELSQLDSSVYTQIFIPSDGEINPSALKYRDQAFGFYDTVIKSIDAVLALASPSDLAAADKIVGTRLKELRVEAPFLFKQFAGDFYRPATP